MASDVFTIMARKNVSPFLIRKIIVIPDISHTQGAEKKITTEGGYICEH